MMFEAVDPLLTGIFASLLAAIFLWIAGWFVREQWRYWKLTRLGCVFSFQREPKHRPVIHVRASLDLIAYGRNPETMRGYTHVGDVLSSMQLARHFDALPVHFNFSFFSEISASMKNIVLIGVSSRSAVSREIGLELYARGIRVRGDNRHAFFKDANGDVYDCNEVEAVINGTKYNIVERDSGVIVRRVLESGAVVTLFGGVHTQGTFAATQVALTSGFQTRVRKSGHREFIQFVTVRGYTAGPSAGLGIHDIQWQAMPLHPLSRYPIKSNDA